MEATIPTDSGCLGVAVDVEEALVLVADESHLMHAAAIAEEIATSASARGTGIARRSIDYLERKMLDGKAVIALAGANRVAGFCYIESWGHDKFVANSGLIVFPEYRGKGLARRIKTAAFELSQRMFPGAKLFGLTTNLAVMNINSDLGYRPVTFSELTSDEAFWNGCKSCVNHPILDSKSHKNCLCTAMLFDPNRVKKKG